MRCEACAASYKLGFGMCEACRQRLAEDLREVMELRKRKLLHCSAIYNHRSCPPGPSCKGCEYWVEGAAGSASVKAAADTGMVFDPENIIGRIYR